MSLGGELASFASKAETSLAIGVFDGVHLGHRHLLLSMVKGAREAKLKSAVVTFFPHPRVVLNSGFVPGYLCSLEERLELIRQIGVELVVPLTFDLEMARLSAEEFVVLLRRHLRMRELWVGPDFAIGRNREGNLAKLAELSRSHGFDLRQVEPLTLGGQAVSSTAIRQALSEGDLEGAASLLGRPVSLRGRVVPGDGRGQALGFPTANLELSPQLALPADGVYVGTACFDGEEWPAAVYVGTRPTFPQSRRIVEAHLLDFRGELRGKNLSVIFLERLRDDMRFGSTASLARQIRADVERARERQAKLS